MAYSVDIGLSRQLAIDHLTTQMQAHMSTELAAVQDDGLYLPAPSDDEYYTIIQNPDEMPSNHNLGVFFYPAGPRTTEARGSAGVGVGEFQKRLTPLRITLICRRQIAQDPLDRNGKELNGDEVLYLRAERYTAAMIKTILKHGYCDAGIIQIDLIEDSADVFFDPGEDRPQFGIATIQIDVRQKVRVPQRA